MRSVRQRLLAHYRRHARDLPWRRTQDPYAIWISEVMLQQTQVDTVVPRWRAFLARFPDVAALAAATETQVCEAWAGLGYYRRARNLHAAARLLQSRHQGTLPADPGALRQLPGIGRYTAGAIASIAFGLEEPLVDGNVVRVLSRLHALDGAADDRRLHETIWQLAAALVRGRDPGALNQALMDLGATICTPRAPRCNVCPLRADCAARAKGPERYPRPAAATVRKSLAIAMAWIEDERGVWLEQRPLDGLWAGLWELPSARSRTELQARFGALGPRLARVAHALSHRQVTATVYRVGRLPRHVAKARMTRFTDPLAAPLSALARRAIVAARK